MNDKPLFQNSDEQEAEYAPEQLPEGSPGRLAADLEDAEDDPANDAPEIVLPAAGLGASGSAGASTGSSGGVAAGIGPALGATVLGEEIAEAEEKRKTHRD